MVELKERLVALDVFRGMTIAGMILVNTPGSWSHVYPPLRHAAWHGFTPTDLVFPFFLFAVGTAMSFSLKKYSSNSSAVSKILRRTLLIFIIGILMNTFPYYTADISTFRIMGVLQRIALAYGLGALLCYFLNQRNLLVVSSIILLVYWGILYYFGGNDPYSLEGNVALRIDLAILTEHHMYKGFGIPFDPEGFLSSISAAINVVIGYVTGRAIQSSKDRTSLLNSLFIAGNLAIFVALAWGMVFPINKPLWTSSYVLMSSGIALNIVAIFIYVIDIKDKKFWIHPFLVFGRNPLIIYVMSIVWVKVYFRIHIGDLNLYGWIYQNVFVPVAGNLNGSLLFALSHVAVLWLIGLILYKKNIIIKI